MLEETFGNRKPVIAMAHFPPLPGAPLYDASAGMDGILDYVSRDLRNLQDGGVDCLMFGNEGDRPYLLSASPESLAAMAAAIGALKGMLRIPFGVNYLWDPLATVALGVATGAAFAREIFTGVYYQDKSVPSLNDLEPVLEAGPIAHQTPGLTNEQSERITKRMM